MGSANSGITLPVFCLSWEKGGRIGFQTRYTSSDICLPVSLFSGQFSGSCSIYLPPMDSYPMILHALTNLPQRAIHTSAFLFEAQHP
jgi:hypothetical protein